MPLTSNYLPPSLPAVMPASVTSPCVHPGDGNVKAAHWGSLEKASIVNSSPQKKSNMIPNNFQLSMQYQISPPEEAEPYYPWFSLPSAVWSSTYQGMRNTSKLTHWPLGNFKTGVFKTHCIDFSLGLRCEIATKPT